MRTTRNECLCLHCTAPVDEAQWYFGLFCECEVPEGDRPIVAAPTLHLDDLPLHNTLSLDEESEELVLDYLRNGI